MKHTIRRIFALVLVLATIVTVLPVATFAASSCKHKKTKTTTYETVYEASSSTEHTRIRYRKEVCKSCDKVLERWNEEKELDHDFDNDVCEDCGYQRTILDLLEQENVIVWKNGSKTVYVQGEKTKWDYAPKNISGTTMVPLVIATETLGGEYLYWDSSSSSAYIELDDEEVEYQKNNKKYWVNGKKKTANQKAQIVDGKIYVELKTLTKLTHQDVDYKDGYVFISDNGVSSKEMKKIIDYLYNGKEDSNLDDIKAGKVYATSSDGKHIYKRTYDASKSCKYSDVYVCTIFNIELPKNAVLTVDGNYLYENGKKAFADVDTLQTADKRISQLNRIIEGADNARNNGVISKSRRNSIRNNAKDTIEEYEAVAKGTKALSKVSEVKASYTAKVGNKNKTVENIQQKLYDLGYTSQLVTGYYGDITFNNIAYFQIVNNLTVTGWVDSTTYNKLFAVKKTSVPETVEIEDIEWEEVENEDGWKEYLYSSGKQFVLGNFTDDVTILGTTLQVGTGLLGVDLPMDIRDVTADFKNWEWTWSHAGQTAIDIIAFVPVIGGIKYFDEAALLVKNGDEILLVTKHADEIVDAGKVINQFDDVVAYIKKHGKLPDNYITKNEAYKLGWKTTKGNLADVAPGKSIGGDIYKNAEGKLPSATGRVWYEADINYTSGYRGNDRLLYSNDGLFYKTTDHYKTFTKIGG